MVHGFVAHSDHLLIILQAEGNLSIKRDFKPFRFEAIWIEASDCEHEVIDRSSNGYHGHGAMGDILMKIFVCSENLTKWNILTFGNFQRKLQQVRTRLQNLQTSDTLHLNKEYY